MRTLSILVNQLTNQMFEIDEIISCKSEDFSPAEIEKMRNAVALLEVAIGTVQKASASVGRLLDAKS